LEKKPLLMDVLTKHCSELMSTADGTVFYAQGVNDAVIRAFDACYYPEKKAPSRSNSNVSPVPSIGSLNCGKKFLVRSTLSTDRTLILDARVGSPALHVFFFLSYILT
jgi:hypothetical protein